MSVTDAVTKIHEGFFDAEKCVQQHIQELRMAGREDDVARVEARLNAARARVREASALLTIAAGRAFSIHRNFAPLRETIEQVCAEVGRFVNESTSFENEVTIDEVEALLAAHEASNEALVQAEISFTASLAHLSAALECFSLEESTKSTGDNQQ